MFEITDTLSLVVPLDKQVRNNIRTKAEHYFSLKKAKPPVSYSTLDKLASTLISKYNLDHDYKAFVMVCCGNAIWRQVVGIVPYYRRMLLLPQCLRNSRLCKGRFDELGLLCSECGNCILTELLHEAETLGYLAVVTEGTTLASRLVESGKVQGIIGVGCLDSLQKMFTSVNKFAVPAIGIPLLTNGCKDTTADIEWIKEEINYFNKESDLRLLNLHNLKDKTAALFTEDNITDLLNLSGSTTDQLVLETLLAGGKRIRPMLAVLTYEMFCSQPSSQIMEHLALSVECFHKASLIHDDIEDNDSIRYGKETIHTQYGIPVAINLGDLLIGEGYRLIGECNLPSDILRECLKIVTRGHKALSLGQGTELMARFSGDILPVDDIVTIYKNKTAAAFKVSLLLGAVAGGAGKKIISLLDHFSHLMGIAYQIQDDLEDFTVENGFTSFENPSVLIAMLAEKVSSDDKDQMKNALSENNLHDLQLLMNKYMIREAITDLLIEYLNKIDTCLKDIQNVGLKLALHEIMGKTFKDYI